MFTLPRFAATALAALGIVAGIASAAGHAAAPAETATVTVTTATAAPFAPAAIHPQEDEPGWDCTTMGNRVCGPQTDRYGAGGGAVCGTDSQCAAWSEAHGEAPTGYAAKPHASEVQTVAYATPAPRPPAGSCSEPLPVPPSSGSEPTTTPQPQPRPLVNVNTATVAELDSLPGIGDVLAARIVQLRPYSSVADLHRVSRLPAKVFPLVTV